MEDTPTSEAHMDKCCDICGDVGVIEAIVTCARCKSSSEHLYCMRTYPEDCPESWYCEECGDFIKGLSSNSPGKLQCGSARRNELPNDPRRNSMDHEKKIQTGKVKPLSPQEVIMLTSGAKKSGSLVKASFHPSTIVRKKRSMLERTPIKAAGIPPKSNSQLVTRNPSLELLKQLRPAMAWQQVAQSFGGLRDAVQAPLLKHTQKEHIQKGQPMDAIKDNADIKRAQITVGKPAKASTTASPLRDDQAIVNSGKTTISVEKNATQAPLEKHTLSQKEYVQKGQSMNAIIDNADIKRAQIAVGKATIASITTSPLRIDQPIVNSGVVVSSNMKIPKAGPSSASPLSASPKVGKCLYIPASDASWKGSFNVLFSDSKQWEISCSIQAHPPSRVRRKVYDSSKLIPEVLEFELVQRGSLWKSLFENYCPDRRDIGLYFFPSNPERWKNYTSLLEHMGEQDLVLRTYVHGRELLIFTSKVLYTDCQRWKGMYFLWGIFGRIKLTITTIQVDVNQCHDEGDDNELVEMEIDMIGGQNVGRLDIAAPRIPRQVPPPNIAMETFYEIAPGFEKVYRPKVQTSYASAAKSGFGARVKVERPDEKNQRCLGTSMRNDDSIQTSSKPMVSPRLDFQHPFKNVKSEFQ